MNYLNFLKMTFLVAGAFLLTGCLGENTLDSPVKSEVTETLPINSMDRTTGAISEDITISIGEDKVTQTKINLSEGTQFINQASKDTVSETPSIKVSVSNDFKESSTELSFSTSDNEKITPTEPIRVSLPAPMGALTGERVAVEIANSISTAKRLEKVIFITVKADGTVDVVINEDLFQGLLIIIIRIEDRSTN